jgi:hypothetical protein
VRWLERTAKLIECIEIESGRNTCISSVMVSRKFTFYRTISTQKFPLDEARLS